VDKDFKMTAVEVKGRNPKFTWEIIGRAPNEGMQVIDRLAAQTNLGNSAKRSTIEDLHLPYADWNGNVEYTSGSQAFVNRLCNMH
jgi:hypothetical protein